MLKSFFTAAVSAAAIAIGGGGALAQSGGSYGSGGSGSGTMEKAPPSGGATGSTSKPAMPTADLKGKDIVNAAGEKIGEVDAIEGNSLIVGVGGFLGIGERKVALSWDQVTMTGTGKDAKLMTNMTKEQLEALPEYKSERGMRGGSGAGGNSSP